MKPLNRKHVHKGASAHKFRKNVGKTHIANLKPMPMRGGWRL